MRGEPRLRVRARVDGADHERPRLDVDLAFPSGITSIVGPSGAGKTTLLVTIAGLATPTSGRITLDDAQLYDASRGALVPTHRRQIALVFQSLALFPHLRVWQNAAYGAPGDKRARRERALHWLERVRASHLADRAPATLSGGEAQRVALARALASEPRALLLDEPFSALDAPLRRALGEDLRALVDELDIPTLLVTHHRDDAMSLGARVVTLEAGRVAADTTAPRLDAESRQKQG
ncbi:MAG: ATP-binding cassette domain-containing protein [Myxococcales bacterium]|nr:ATP-binding cassette domain-containing protein [Myxococcales bacterium]